MNQTTPKRPARVSLRSPFLLPAISVFAFVVAFAALLAVLSPAPPRTVMMATGAPGSAYAEFGERYRALLARHGVTLELVATNGAVDNVRALGDASSGVSVAFVQGGIAHAEKAPELVSLGTVFYEPVWFFVRGDLPLASRHMLAGRRVSIGPEGSGTHQLASDLITAVGLDVTGTQMLDLTAQNTGEALLRGEIDMAVMVAPWEYTVVRQLLASERINAISFRRADAHIALRPYLNKLVVPQGVADLAKDRPPTDVVLVAPKCSLVVRNDLHPAIQYLLLDAAMQLHSKPGIFQKAGQFPAAEPIDLPLSEQAQRFYQTGPPFLQRYLPFWLAVFVARLLLLLIPILGVAYPTVRLLQAIYGWGMRRRIFNLYGELKFLEADLEARAPGAPAEDLQASLEKLEFRANHMRVPVGFAHMLYTLRTHIGLVRARLEQR
ncbi:MAG TPA: TAXI family TRAP transporter solute-binding subunit [Burkholderiales bacterium]|nr:TAXI family TRAP transporter solute-binding subunit [Burkholderiales bacterium]